MNDTDKWMKVREAKEENKKPKMSLKKASLYFLFFQQILLVE